MRGANLYVTTPASVVPGLTCGQWVPVSGYARKGRFVRYNEDGSAYVMRPVSRKGKLNMVSFRLACGKTLAQVMSKTPVNGTIVKNTI